MLRAKAFIKNRLPAFLVRPLLNLYHRSRGITTAPLSHAMIAKMINRPNPIILEIGCNDGTDTRLLLQAMPHARIYCFEPDPRAAERFKTKLGKDLAKVKLFQMAISDRSGQIAFHTSTGGDTPGGYDQSGSIRHPKKPSDRAPINQVR